ncbi:MAG: DNA primase [Candidatus Roizmanbacteria bacterium]|nr:DNA primase [Candidatus Roizmanbacteria bacterium]
MPFEKRYMSQVDEIKKRIDIVEYIGTYVSLKNTGRNFQGLCPFHAEKTPSFVVSPDRQIWHCFGACAEGGDVISFVMKLEGISFVEALSNLAQLTGVKLDTTTISDDSWKEKEKLFSVNNRAAEFFHYILTEHKIGKKALEYLLSRGLNQGLIAQFQIGYAPDSWRSLHTYLIKKKVAENTIVETGLVVQGKQGVYDRFRGRIMFPLKDMRGHILGFSGRILESSDKGAKYINTPETILYHKRETLFGIDRAIESIRKSKEAILMEGEFDVILAHREGFTNAVAIKGSALTTEQLRLLGRIVDTLVFALDMDKAGTEAIKRGISLAEETQKALYVLAPLSGKDPADTFLLHPYEFKQAYKHKETIYDFLLRMVLAKFDVTTLYGRKAIIDEIIPFLSSINNPVIFDFFIKRLASKTDTDISAIRDSIRTFTQKRKANIVGPVTEIPKKRKKEEMLDEYLLALLIQRDNKTEISEMIEQENIQDMLYLSASTRLIRLLLPCTRVNTLPIAENIPSELIDYFNRCFLLLLPEHKERKQEKKEIIKTILQIKRLFLKRKIQLKDEPNIDSYIKELSRVEKSLSIV